MLADSHPSGGRLQFARSEANAPLARATLGGLLAGEPATLFVLPALYSVLVRDEKLTEPNADFEGAAIEPAH